MAICLYIKFAFLSTTKVEQTNVTANAWITGKVRKSPAKYCDLGS